MNVNSIWDLGIRIWDFRFSLDPGKFHSCSNAETAEDAEVSIRTSSACSAVSALR